VFADICELRRGLTEDDVTKIQGAVDSGAITIPGSYILIEETISLLSDSEESEAGYRQHIKTVLSLIDADRIIKQHNELTREDCRSYAFGESRTDRTRALPAEFRKVLDLSINRNDLKSLADQIRMFHESIAADIQEDMEKAIVESERRGIGKANSFQEVWEQMALLFVERLVDGLPRNEKRLCRKKGLRPMLNIKSIRLYTIYSCWLRYWYWLRSDGTPGRVKSSDGGDFFHAVCASAADIFVTQESVDKKGKLPWILSQIPTQGLKVMSIQELSKTL
jgi:hypothetical protein